MVNSMQFEWDFEKETANVNKHGLTFSTAVECFYDPKGIQLVDSRHSVAEPRYYWVGKASDGRILTTWYTLRKDTIRIIGCAEWRKMRSIYYEKA
jgi:uncharacterized DUF497 family protein